MAQPDPSNKTSSGAALEQAFEVAISLHEQQRLVEAEKSYRLILQADPTHFGALQYLGMLCAQRYVDAVAGVRRHSIAASPTITMVTTNRPTTIIRSTDPSC